jgi:hypothetical protein
VTEGFEQRLETLEARIAALEVRLPKLTPDENDGADTERILQLVRETEGMSQRGICVVARHYHGLSRQRVVDILRTRTGELWRVESGAWHSLLYFPLHGINALHGTAGTTDVDDCGSNGSGTAEPL